MAEEHVYGPLMSLMGDYNSLESLLHAIDQRIERAKEKNNRLFLGMTRASIERSYDRFGLSARDALECFLIELLNAYNWGSLAPPPHVVKSRGKIQVEPAKKGKSHKKQRRQEIVRPLALAEAKSIGNHPYIIAKRIKDKVNGQLKKEDRVKERVLCDDVRAILGRE